MSGEKEEDETIFLDKREEGRENRLSGVWEK